MNDPGKVAYEAYAAHANWKSLHTGEDLPKWHALSLEIQTAWRVAADSVLHMYGV